MVQGRVAEVAFRRATSSDLSALAGIEAEAGHGRWSAHAFAQELGLAWSRTELVVGHGDALPVGFMVYWLVADELQLLNIATAKAHQRQGIGTLMMKRLLDVAVEAGTRRIFLEVRSRNLPAQALYGRFGFQVAGVRRGYYGDDGDDALLMERTLVAGG